MRIFQSKGDDEVRPGRVRRMLALVGASALIAAGGIAASAPAMAVDGGVVVNSSDMTDGTALNPMFACTSGAPLTGGLISPELAIDFGSVSPAPASFAIIMHDEFGIDTEYGAIDWAHWVAYNMTPAPSGVTEVTRNASQTDALLGGTEGQNTWGQIGYRGPCPPSGDHTYIFTVYALDGPISPLGTTPSAIMAAMQGHILDQGDLTVTFASTAVNTNSAQVELEFPAMTDAAESAGTATLPSLLVNGVVSAPATATVMLDASACVDPGATFGADYSFTGGSATFTVNIPAGTYDGRAGTAVPIPGTLSILDDVLVEGTECLTLNLIDVTGGGAEIGDAGHTDPIGPGSAHQGFELTATTLRILDDDSAAPVPTIEFAAGTASGSESVAGTLPQLLVNGTLAASVQVTVGVTGGTATGGTDYTAPTVVTIPAGTYDGTAGTAVSIPGFAVLDDTTYEPDETVIFSLTSADTAALVVGDANGDTTTQSGLTFTILDDDLPLPTIEFAAVSGSASEGSGGQLPLLLVNGTLAAPVQVTVDVAGGTANGSDFTAPTTVTIPAGTYDGTAATGVAIPGFTITDDAVVEPDETVLFSLASSNTAVLVVGDANGNGTTIAALTFTITNDDSAPTPTPSPGPSGGAAASGSGNLAATGGELGSSLFIGLGLLLLGALAVVRRTRKA